jgi:hypothetical protein
MEAEDLALLSAQLSTFVEEGQTLMIDTKAGKYVLINRSTYQVKPFCLSSETVLPIKRNRSTYRVKPFYLSRETVLPIK